MSNHAPKVDPVAKLFFLISLVAILLTVYVLVSSLINTFQKNSTKGEPDNTMKVVLASENLKPIGVAATSDAPVKTASASARPGKEVYTAVCAACHAVGVANAPKLGDKAAWEPRVTAGMDSMMAIAIKGKGAMPPRAGQNIVDAELKAAITYMVKESGLSIGAEDVAEETKAAATPVKEEPKAEAPAVEEAPKAEPVAKAPVEEAQKTEAVAEAPVKESPDAVVETAAAPAPVASAPSADGKKVYDATCFTCHNTGVANSPIMGNKEAWAPRIALGMDAMYETAIKGKGAMPPKGGNLSLDEDKVKAAVDYMVSKSQ